MTTLAVSAAILLVGVGAGGLVARLIFAGKFSALAVRWDAIAVDWRRLGVEDRALDAERNAAKCRRPKYWVIF